MFTSDEPFPKLLFQYINTIPYEIPTSASVLSLTKSELLFLRFVANKNPENWKVETRSKQDKLSKILLFQSSLSFFFSLQRVKVSPKKNCLTFWSTGRFRDKKWSLFVYKTSQLIIWNAKRKSFAISKLYEQKVFSPCFKVDTHIAKLLRNCLQNYRANVSIKCPSLY